jgi:cell division protein ZapA (FtsZ GTPase activity inhibitor)
MSQPSIVTAGEHAAAASAVIGLGVLVCKPIRGWRKRRKAEKQMVLDALKANSEKLDSIQANMQTESKENREVHGRIEEKVDALAEHTRLVMTASINIIDALCQHDEKINGTVKEYRKSLSDMIVKGVGN